MHSLGYTKYMIQYVTFALIFPKTLREPSGVRLFSNLKLFWKSQIDLSIEAATGVAW
jgi:hypothetical protein